MRDIRAYVNALTSGREYPGLRSLRLVAAALGMQPRYFAEYRLAELHGQLDGRRIGFRRRLATLLRSRRLGAITRHCQLDDVLQFKQRGAHPDLPRLFVLAWPCALSIARRGMHYWRWPECL